MRVTSANDVAVMTSHGLTSAGEDLGRAGAWRRLSTCDGTCRRMERISFGVE